MTDAQPKEIDRVETFLIIPDKTNNKQQNANTKILSVHTNCDRDYSSLSIIVQCTRNACTTTQIMKGHEKEEPRRKWNSGQDENRLTP